MEINPDEFVGSSSNDPIHTVVKGRRTKRQRLLLNSSTTCGGAALSSTSSSGGAAAVEEEEDLVSSSSHTVISGEVIDDHHLDAMSTEEEEDMANCLILLAQGDGHGRRRPRQTAATTTTTTTQFGKVGFYIYECKTCNRTFPSFQALGGHRASHKKPKMSTATPAVAAAAVDEKVIKKLPIVISREKSEEREASQLIMSKSVQVQLATSSFRGGSNSNLQGNKTKLHECSICGLEFTSGQALGGHMRRHRSAVSMNSNSNTETTEMKQRNILQLDLNLPAPEEELRETKFQFTATPQTIVFSSPTLVDCHY